MENLILILGPMKSGKSCELISHFAPLQYTDIPYNLFHSVKNVRDETIASRNGPTIHSQKIADLSALLETDYQVVGIDEVHMFDPEGAKVIEQLLRRGTQVICSGLDMDYQGRLFAIVQGLLELGPNEVRYKRAVCEVCRRFEAVYTQVCRNDQPICEGLPPVLPEDGTYTYISVCRNCFKCQ